MVCLAIHQTSLSVDGRSGFFSKNFAAKYFSGSLSSSQSAFCKCANFGFNCFREGMIKNIQKYSSRVRKKIWTQLQGQNPKFSVPGTSFKKLLWAMEPTVRIRFVPNLDNFRIRKDAQITFLLYDKSDEYFSVKEKLKKLFCEISLNLKGQWKGGFEEHVAVRNREKVQRAHCKRATIALTWVLVRAISTDLLK